MKLELSNEDIERLADILERRIAERGLVVEFREVSWKTLREEAEKFTLQHIEDKAFKREALSALKNEFKASGKQMLRRMVLEAVGEIHGQCPDLKREVAKGIYEAALEAAERLRYD